ncbi:MAG: efflux RND transporter periplasmic adaptor subunit [Desulfuromonadales bacterium]|nr:efflux RND transporter periplasmic adaptor subunit [Desulfuromonadales bacterium]MBN2793655.1 efflux RND transporter periplasmic adaptor subunit [Desulfuromonadales bacterium]
MKITASKVFYASVLSAATAGLWWFFVALPQSPDLSAGPGRSSRLIPVEVAPIERGTIVQRRMFSGALEPRAEFVIAPKVGGRVERLTVKIADAVTRGQLVAELDNDEHVQAVNQAEAEMAVSQARLAEARSRLTIADRELDRVRTLRRRGVASEAQLDEAAAEQLTRQVERDVAQAELVYAEAVLETARIRLGYTRITADWSGGADRRVVAERYIDEGAMVAANAPLLRIVELDPLAGVVFVAERDYALLEAGQKIVLTTDAFPGQEFHGQIERIAPVFKQSTRQARVELKIDNPGQQLKPGMFIRAVVALESEADAIIVPEQALIRRDDQLGLFLVSADGLSVRWTNVTAGIREGDRVQVAGAELFGRVVVLGQQLLNDGSAITIPAEQQAAPGGDKQAGQR